MLYWKPVPKRVFITIKFQSCKNYQYWITPWKLNWQIHYNIKHLNLISYIFTTSGLMLSKNLCNKLGLQTVLLIDMTILVWYLNDDCLLWPKIILLCYHLLTASLITVVRPSNFLYQDFLIFETYLPCKNLE